MVSEKKSKTSQPIRGWGGHLVFSISPKNTNLVTDFEILLPVKFLWIPFSSFIREVENFSANQRPGRPSWFSDRPDKHKLVEDVEILLPVKFRWIPFNDFRGEVENTSANQRPGRPSCFSDRAKKHKLGRGSWDLVSCQVSMNFVRPFQRRSRKWRPSCFQIGPKNTNLLEDVEILLPFRFRWIPFSGFREEVESGGHLVFQIGPKNTNLLEDVQILLPFRFLEFRSAVSKKKSKMWKLTTDGQTDGRTDDWQRVITIVRKSRKCLSQSEAWTAILFFRSAWKTQTW